MQQAKVHPTDPESLSRTSVYPANPSLPRTYFRDLVQHLRAHGVFLLEEESLVADSEKDLSTSSSLVRSSTRTMACVWFSMALFISAGIGVGLGFATGSLDIGLATGTAVLTVLMAVQGIVRFARA